MLVLMYVDHIHMYIYNFFISIIAFISYNFLEVQNYLVSEANILQYLFIYLILYFPRLHQCFHTIDSRDIFHSYCF